MFSSTMSARKIIRSDYRPKSADIFSQCKEKPAGLPRCNVWPGFQFNAKGSTNHANNSNLKRSMSNTRVCFCAILFNSSLDLED